MVEDLTSLIREALAHERQARGWTREQQAKHHNVDPTTIWRWENGDTGKAAAVLIPLVRNVLQMEAAQAA